MTETAAPAHRRRHAEPGSRRIGWIAAVGVAAAGAVAAAATTRSSAPDPIEPTAADGGGHWQHVMERLDARRAAAWESLDAAGLDAVYVAGSGALLADRRMLAAYAARGLSPSGVRLQFSSVDLVSRTSGQVELSAVDRLGAVHVRAADGTVSVLPADRATAHSIVLRRVGGQWLIASVRAR